MPPLECANFLECENKTVCVAPFDLPHGSNTSFFHHIIYQKIITIHPTELFFSFLFFFGAKMAWNAIVCETTDVSRENSIFPIFQKTWFQAILAKRKNEKKKRKKRENHRVRSFMECEDLAECVDFTVCVRPYSCGVRCPRWSAKNLWNAKNSEYA